MLLLLPRVAKTARGQGTYSELPLDVETIQLA